MLCGEGHEGELSNAQAAVGQTTKVSPTFVVRVLVCEEMRVRFWLE